MERGRGGAGHAAGRGADRAWWAKSVCCAGDERGDDYTWNADACASADHVAAAVGADPGSREYIAATVAFELDAAADGRSQSTQLGE